MNSDNYPGPMLKAAADACSSTATELEEVLSGVHSAHRMLRYIARRLPAEAVDPRPSLTCSRCSPPCDRLQDCAQCGRPLPHDYVHWNGAFEQCEHCAAVEAGPALTVAQDDLPR